METLQQHTSTATHGIIICLVGILLCYFVGRRRFRRRGIGGLQYFNSYGSALVTTLFEKVVKIIGIILIIIGLFIALDSRKKQVRKTVTKQRAAVLTHHIQHKKSN